MNQDQEVLRLIESNIRTRLDAVKKARQCLSFDVFTLGCCFIDQISGFYCGKQDKNAHPEYFKKFVTDFLSTINPAYDASEMYTDLRCGLVHSAAPGKHFLFTHENKDGNHLSWVDTDDGKRLLFKLDDFVSHLEQATESYLKELKQDPMLQTNALNRSKIGLLRSGIGFVSRP